MNFEALEWLVKNILKSFQCKKCLTMSKKWDIFIREIYWNTASIEVICQKCGNKTSMQTEVVSIDLTKHLNNKQLEDLKKNFLNTNKKNLISDSEIVKLDKELKKEKFNVSDLFEEKS